MFSVHGPASLVLQRRSGRAELYRITEHPTSTEMNSSLFSRKRNLAAIIVMTAVCSTLNAASIAIPNGSFESPTLPVGGISTSIGSWQKTPQPAYYDPAT